MATLINYINGDATSPVGSGEQLLCHVCNDVGAFARGFAAALSIAMPEAKRAYLDWKRSGRDVATNAPFCLGEIQSVAISARPQLKIVNMIAQRGLRSAQNPMPLRYNHLSECLTKTCELALREARTIHMPRIGAGLAGGDWEVIEEIVHDRLCVYKVKVFVYDLTARSVN